jgi:hypothetical protein
MLVVAGRARRLHVGADEPDRCTRLQLPDEIHESFAALIVKRSYPLIRG